jgi:hypothetical protein
MCCRHDVAGDTPSGAPRLWRLPYPLAWQHGGAGRGHDRLATDQAGGAKRGPRRGRDTQINHAAGFSPSSPASRITSSSVVFRLWFGFFATGLPSIRSYSFSATMIVPSSLPPG